MTRSQRPAAADSESPPPHAVVAEAFVTGKGFHLAHTKRFIASQCDHGYALRECRVRLADSNRPGLSQASRQGPVIDNNDGGSTKLGRHGDPFRCWLDRTQNS